MSLPDNDQVSLSASGDGATQAKTDAVVQTLPTAAQSWEDLVRARLAATGYPALRQLTCESREGQLLLRGSVPLYYQKQVALACVQDIPGVRVVADEIQVVDDHTDEVPHA